MHLIWNKSIGFNIEIVDYVPYIPKNGISIIRKNNGKEVFNPCKCRELLRLSERRIEDLQMYLIGGPADQQDCPSKLNE